MAAVADFPEVKRALTNPIRREIVISYNENFTGGRNENYIEFDFSEITKESTLSSTNVEKTNIIDFSFNANFQQIQNKFERELAKYSNYISSDIEEAQRSFSEISKSISKINYEKIALEITPSNAVKFTIILNDTSILSVTKPFDKIDDLNENEVVFNLYKNRELLVSDATKVDELVKGINSYVQM